ncbi:MAG: hypothetical protein WA733_20835 [Methylocystis sp.]
MTLHALLSELRERGVVVSCDTLWRFLRKGHFDAVPVMQPSARSPASRDGGRHQPYWDQSPNIWSQFDEGNYRARGFEAHSAPRSDSFAIRDVDRGQAKRRKRSLLDALDALMSFFHGFAWSRHQHDPVAGHKRDVAVLAFALIALKETDRD